MSTATVHPRQWRLTLSVLLFTMIAGAALLTALALGIADPPRVGQRIWQSTVTDNWPLYHTTAEADLYLSPSPLPQPPFTLEITAANHGIPLSAWGIWLEADKDISWMLVSNEGYVSFSADDHPHWTEFFHTRPITNKLYVHAEANNNATFRVNDEIAWTGTLITSANWGIAFFRNPDVQWDTISMYASTP